MEIHLGQSHSVQPRHRTRSTVTRTGDMMSLCRRVDVDARRCQRQARTDLSVPWRGQSPTASWTADDLDG